MAPRLIQALKSTLNDFTNNFKSYKREQTTRRHLF